MTIEFGEFSFDISKDRIVLARMGNFLNGESNFVEVRIFPLEAGKRNCSRERHIAQLA